MQNLRTLSELRRKAEGLSEPRNPERDRFEEIAAKWAAVTRKPERRAWGSYRRAVRSA